MFLKKTPFNTWARPVSGASTTHLAVTLLAQGLQVDKSQANYSKTTFEYIMRQVNSSVFMLRLFLEQQ